MIGKIVFLALCGVAFGRATVSFQGFAFSGGNDLKETYSEEDAVKNLTSETMKKVLEVEVKLTSISQEFEETRKAAEKTLRSEIFDFRCDVSSYTYKATFDVVSATRPFSVFECVVAAEEESIRKLQAIAGATEPRLKQIQDKSLSQVRIFESSTTYFYSYIRNLASKKISELNQVTDAKLRKKIVKEVQDKMDYIHLILYQIKDRVKVVTQKLESELWQCISSRDMSKLVRDGIEKINKCLTK